MGNPFLTWFDHSFPYASCWGCLPKPHLHCLHDMPKLPRLSCGYIWAYAGCPEKGKWLVELRKDGYFNRHGFWTPTNTNPLFDLRTWWSVRSLWVIIWYNLAAIFGLGGVFTALGGTVIQWIGVYNSRKCDLTVAYWTGSTPGQKVVLSNNTALQIKTAATYWKACSITATIFLGVVCFGGWCYQRRFRGLFRVLVNDLDSPCTDGIDVVHIDTPPFFGASVDWSTYTKSEATGDVQETHEPSSL